VKVTTGAGNFRNFSLKCQQAWNLFDQLWCRVSVNPELVSVGCAETLQLIYSEYDCVLHGLIFLRILVWHGYGSRVWKEWSEIGLMQAHITWLGNCKKLQNSCFRIHRYCWLSAEQAVAVAVSASHFSKQDKCTLSEVLRVWLQLKRNRYGTFTYIGVKVYNSGIKLHFT
jgi:hypothetical protein